MDAGGLEAVKARAIAKRAEVSVGSVYNLFGNIDGLLQVANSHILADMNKAGQTQTAHSENDLQAKIASGDIADNIRAKLLFRLLALANTYMNFVEKNGNRWSAMLAFNRTLPAAAPWYVEQQNALYELVGKVLEPTRLGEPEKRKIAARALWSAVHGIVSMSYVGQVTPQTRTHTWQQIEILVTYFVDGLLAE